MKWNLKGKTTSQGLIALRVLAQGSIPVLLVATGRAVSFVSDTGESIDAHPHVTVSLGESWTYGPDGSDVCVTHYFISAYGAAGRARNLVLPVLPYQNCAPLRTGAEIQALIDGLAPKIAEAVAMCGRLDEIFSRCRASHECCKPPQGRVQHQDWLRVRVRKSRRCCFQ